MKFRNTMLNLAVALALFGTFAVAEAQGQRGGRQGGGQGGPGMQMGQRRQGGEMFIIRMSTVQAELHLTQDQIAKIKNLRGPGGPGGPGGPEGGQGGPGRGPGGPGGPEGGQGGPGRGPGGPGGPEGGQGGPGRGPGGPGGPEGGQGGPGRGPVGPGGPEGGQGGPGRGPGGPEGGQGGPGRGPGGPGGPEGGQGGPGRGPGGPGPLADILNQAQMKRLHQLALQFDAPMTLLDRKVSQDLEITEAQRTAIDTVIRENMPRPQQGQNPPTFAQMQAGKNAAKQAAFAALTGDQRSKWGQMVGAQFNDWVEPTRPQN